MKKHTIIEIYPECEIADWIKPEAWCNVYGEGTDVFIIKEVNERSVVLYKRGCFHGAESITKLHRTFPLR